MTDECHPLPEFLLPATEEQIKYESRVARIELEQTVFTIAFNHILDELACATPLVDICREYHTNMDPNRLRAWMLRDPSRAKAYHLAMGVGAETLEDEIIRIADAEGSLEDVARSKLKVDTRKWIMRARSPKRYGDTKDAGVPSVPQININIGGVESPYATIDNGDDVVTIDG